MSAAVLFLILVAACSKGANEVSDTAVISAMQRVWNQDDARILLGAVRFARDGKGGDFGKRLAPASAYQIYKALAERGILTMNDERDPSSNFTGWNDFFSLTQQGVQRVATVALTEKGLRIATLEGQKDIARFKIGTYTFGKVVSGEAIEAPAEKYWVAYGTGSFTLVPELGDVWSIAGTRSRELRFRALMKFDPINSRWNLESADLGNKDGNFDSENVTNTIRKFRS